MPVSHTPPGTSRTHDDLVWCLAQRLSSLRARPHQIQHMTYRAGIKDLMTRTRQQHLLSVHLFRTLTEHPHYSTNSSNVDL